ncbi:MAG: insulinase family protein [Candidatus Eisenbacteria bacterium]
MQLTTPLALRASHSTPARPHAGKRGPRPTDSCFAPRPRRATASALGGLPLFLAVTVVLAALAWPNATQAAPSVIDLELRRPGDESQIRAFTLDNQLQVLLVSDPSMQKSAAALDVAVGSLEDPDNQQGVAHFLEHLLFLGTEKYPDVDEYSAYLSANNGSSNAYTADENTNYQLEVNPDAFEGALDRFAQFFVAPLFDPEFVDRERNAVNSEHQKNVQNDFWRFRQIQQDLYREGHPQRKFSTGTLETLADATREEIIGFYQKYYSANVMRLCVMGPQDLDTMEGWVKDRFAAIPNRNRGDLTYPTDVWNPSDIPRLVQIKPVTEARTLELQFASPSVESHWQEKPDLLLGSLIGHEGKGSLLSELKKRDLATGLGAGSNTSSFTTQLSYRITLTENGRAHVDEVIDLFFSYIDMLRKSGLPEYYYDEEKTMSDIGYVYRDHEEGMWTASTYASLMQDYPPAEILKDSRLFFKYDPNLFKAYLDKIRPELMQVTLSAPDVETSEVEPFYGAEYQATKIPAEKIERWKKAKATGAFKYPEPNPFLPDNLSLLENDTHTEPYKLIDDQRGTYWFEQDKTFHLPKAQVSLLLLTDLPKSSPRQRLLSILYARAIDEGLNEWRYPALLAGLGASVAPDLRGIQLSVGGYSQRVPELLEELATRLRDVTIDDRTFAAIKDDLRREVANAEFGQAYQQLFYEYNFLMNPDSIHRREYQDMIASVTLDDVKKFAKEVLRESAVEGVAYGNLDGQTLAASLSKAFQEASGKTLPEDRRPKRPVLQLPAGHPMAYVFSTKSDNSCWGTSVQFGPRDYRREAILRVGAAALESGFYTEMRSRQQLGYIVWSFANVQGEIPGMWFVIQSGDYSATELAARATTWLAETVPSLREIPEDEFAGLKASIVEDLRQVDTDINERMGTLDLEAVRFDGDFEHDDRVIAELESLTAGEVASAFETAFAGQPRLDLDLL